MNDNINALNNLNNNNNNNNSDIVKTLIFATLYNRFWNSNGGIISKWLRMEKLTTEEHDTFKEYLTNMVKVYVNINNLDQAKLAQASIDDLMDLLFNIGIDAI